MDFRQFLMLGEGLESPRLAIEIPEKIRDILSEKYGWVTAIGEVELESKSSPPEKITARMLPNFWGDDRPAALILVQDAVEGGGDLYSRVEFAPSMPSDHEEDEGPRLPLFAIHAKIFCREARAPDYNARQECWFLPPDPIHAIGAGKGEMIVLEMLLLSQLLGQNCPRSITVEQAAA
ncbi:MAG TPA: hypothetical protein VG984_03935 [Candidatus Paceibacterota bacterium]|nr:hypothetical protein [Candidatus Paceibacterota bacterium]